MAPVILLFALLAQGPPSWAHDVKTRVTKTADSEEVVVEVDGVQAGRRQDSTGVYDLVWERDPLALGLKHRLHPHKVTKEFPAEGDPLPPPPGPSNPIADTPVASDHVPVVIDVNVFYSAAALVKIGGPTKIAAYVALSCALSNQSYANSGLGWITWRCFGPFQSAYNETTDGEALRWMSSATICATVNGVQTCHPGGLTDTNDKLALTGADLSHLVTTNGACGLGFLEPAANAAMSMSEWSCTNANLSFTHETGHNVGFNHDPKNAGSPPCPEPTNTNCAIYCPSGLACFPGISNFGHAWPIAAPQWRSIMAYPSAGGARITQISNPSILYQGYPTGIPGERDNAKKAVERAPIVAAFRMAVNPPQMPAAPGKPTVH